MCSRPDCLSITCIQVLVALTQSIHSQRLINSALRQSSYLQSPIVLHSDQKVQRIQLSTDRILIARFKANHITYIAQNLHSRDNSYLHSTQITKVHLMVFWRQHPARRNPWFASVFRVWTHPFLHKDHLCRHSPTGSIKGIVRCRHSPTGSIAVTNPAATFRDLH